MAKIGRNDPCRCGSGRKYKNCCGNSATLAAGQVDGPPSAALLAMKQEALHWHARGELGRAAEFCSRVLSHNPKDFDALHLLGVIYGHLKRHGQALQLMLEAVSVATTDYPPLFDNLGRSIAAAATELGAAEKILCPDLLGEDIPQRLAIDDLSPLPDTMPSVSIVVPSYNHERYVVEALRSVYAQSYPRIEIIVIDDGSRDRSVEMIKAALGESPYPVKLVTRENRGASATLNEGMDLATGSYLGILNSDDRYQPQRVESLVRLLSSSGKQWGFSGVNLIGGDGGSIRQGQHRHADFLMNGLDRLYSGGSVTLGFVWFNFAASTGNLFFSRKFWQSLGGFSDYRYLHDWDFCLRALEFESPAILSDQTYDYRLHGENTISEDSGNNEAGTASGLLYAWGRQRNKAQQEASIRGRLIACARDYAIFVSGHGHLIERRRLLALANRLAGMAPKGREPWR